MGANPASFAYFRYFYMTNIAQIWPEMIRAETMCKGQAVWPDKNRQMSIKVAQ